MSSCPQLCEVQTAMQNLLVPGRPQIGIVFSTYHVALLNSCSLILGNNYECLDGELVCIATTVNIRPEHVILAHELFGRLRRLEVTTANMETVAEISRFTDITELSLTLIDLDMGYTFSGTLETALKRLRLKYLSLRCVKDVIPTAIARHWPNLETLLLIDCTVAESEERELQKDSLQNLVTLRMGFFCDTQSSEKLAMEAAETLLGATAHLVTLRVDGELLCPFFVFCCCYKSMPCLEHLTLATNVPLPELGLTVGDLRNLVDALPSLRHVATDSYDIRLFLQCYARQVNVHWTQCTTCMAEFPLIDQGQELMWKGIQTST